MSRGRAGSLAAFAASLLMTSCGGGGGGGGYTTSPSSAATPTPAPSPAATADVVITIAGMSFSPNSVAVQAGQTVAWKNGDSVTHSATQDGGTFDTGPIPAGATSAAITISSTTALKYHCMFHPGMVASLNGGSSGGGGGY
ncbi:MAG TPA: plastocyanin/azurin family copper-binding protein [Vicinamibacteria bacterium]|nr:plastocyanin/azurin family copper-binding protein [Vicinamibacteria bacterium]